MFFFDVQICENFVEYYQMHFANCSPVYGILTFLNFEKAFLVSDVRIRSDWFVFLLDRAERNVTGV